MAQGSEEPPFLRVGTEVSAKYRGAFCEASIKTIKKHVKCKIQYKDNTTATLTDDVVKGDLKVGSNVEVKTPDGRVMNGVIIKLTDASTYTVVFDDGDERTLRRSSLCLKGERHFNESETLDHLPLTDPENFGTPVMQNGKKRKKRRPSNQQSSSVDDAGSEREDRPIPPKKKCLFNESIVGKVVVVERGTRRKSHWFPALGVSPSQENMTYIKSKDQCLVRSFKDGNYHVISIRDTKEFSKDHDPVSSALKTDNRASKPAIERAVAYIETGRVPSIWEGNKSEVITHDDVEDDSKKSASKLAKPASSDDETEEDAERDAFTEKLQTFMEENGTPIIRAPILGNQDLDLHKLYSLVIEAGGMEEVTKQQQWRNIYSKMGIAIMPPSASHHIKMAYKKYLQLYEEHKKGENTGSSVKDSDEEKLEIPTPKNGRTRHERNSKSSVRQGATEKAEKTSADKRAKAVSTEKVEEKSSTPVKPALNKSRRSTTPNKPGSKSVAPVTTPNKQASKPVVPVTTPNKPASKPVLPVTTPNKPASKPDLPVTTPNKPASKPDLPVTTPNKPASKPAVPNKLPLTSISTTLPNKQATTPTGKTTAKSSVSKQATTKPSTPDSKERMNDEEKEEIKVENENGEVLKSEVKDVSMEEPVDVQRSLKHQDSIESDIDIDEEVTSPESELAVDVVNSPGCMSDTSESKSDTRSDVGTDDVIDCIVGDKIQVKYGRGRNRRLYEAKIVTVDPDADEGLLYLIHYAGWNIRYDEWISPDRVLCKNNKQSKKKGAVMKEFQRSKLPPKPIGKQFIRSVSKKGTKSPSPASPNGKPSDAKVPQGNGNKNSHRNSPSPPQTESLSSSSSSNCSKITSKGNTPTRRTRSERNSTSSVSNGLDEAVKSPPSKRRQKSLTPEPADKQSPEKLKEASSSTSPSEGIKDSSGSYDEATEPQIKKETKLDNEGQEHLGSSPNPQNSKLETSKHKDSNDQNSLDFPTNKPWSKLPNGLTNYSSSESGSPEHSASDNDMEPATKKMKLEKEIENENIKRFLNEVVEHKTPVAAPHSKGSSSSEEQDVCVSAEVEERGKDHRETGSKENVASPETNGNSRAGSSEPESGKEGSSTNVCKENIKSEKKDGDHRNKRNRKKKERKKNRRHSVNDNNSDAPASPSEAHSPSSKPSPTRPKISFDAELESIKSMEDGTERIRLLQLKINEMRKIYGSLKAEVASIDRKRKKLKKKREEDAASSSHDSSTKSPNSNHVTSSPATVECR